MFNNADALFVAVQLKAVVGRAIVLGLVFLVGQKYIREALDDLHKM